MLKDKILITGATGCLGSNLTHRLLSEGAEVVVFKRHAESLGSLTKFRNSFEVRFGDVRDLDSLRRAMQGIGRVYHLAGIAIPLNRLASQMWEVNVVGTYNVARAALDQGVERLVHISSIAAIGYPPDGVIASEKFDFRDSVATNAYSLTKRRGEEIALSFNGPMEVVAVNPSAVIAPGGSRRYGWAALIKAAQRGSLRIYPSGGSAFCAGRDLVDGLLRAMQRGHAGERYILSSENVSYKEMGCRLAEIIQVAPPRFRPPKWVFDWVGRTNDCFAALLRDHERSPILVSENTELMCRKLYYDPSKAVREIGLSQSSLIEAMRELYEWCESEAVPAFA
jgi:dihydroflavonol-4-reductase